MKIETKEMLIRIERIEFLANSYSKCIRPVGRAAHDETTLDVLGTMRQVADWFMLLAS